MIADDSIVSSVEREVVNKKVVEMSRGSQRGGEMCLER